MNDARPHASPEECPALETLVGFSLGELADPEFESVAIHLSRCGNCLAVIADLHARSTKDFLEERVRDCLDEPSVRRDLFDTPVFDRAAETATAVALATPSLLKSVPASEDVAGRRVGRYVLVRRLGEGGMGVVCLARDPEMGQLVALKMLTVASAQRQDRIDRFRKEGQALARLRHPNVVQFYHFDEHEGQPYFTMEHVPGGNLQSRLRKPMPFREAAELIRTLAAAIHAVHLEKVIHRDLKPANILFAADGTAKIADFGLAKLTDTDGKLDLTKSGMVLGSLSYMSPEQAEGRISEIDQRTDVYALGAVLYATLTGRPPYEGKVMYDTLQLIGKAELPPPSLHRKELPRDLERICTKCLSKPRSRRHDSAQALADDLTDWLEGRHPRSLPGRTKQAFTMTRRKAIVAGLGLAAASVGALAYQRDPDRILREIEATLRAGKPVTLIGEKGKPAWSRWRMGEKRGQVTVSKEGLFNVQMLNEIAMVELLPDPQMESYRVEAEIRHETTNRFGGPGLFLACQSHPAGAAEINFYIELSFNDVRKLEDIPHMPHPDRPLPPLKRNVQLHPRLSSQPGVQPYVERQMGGVPGPSFTPAGEAGSWRTLEAIVTPEGIKAQWDGQSFALSADQIGESVAFDQQAPRPKAEDNPFVRQLQPAYTPRGGFGLFMFRGSASFRSVTITPLTPEGNANA